MAWLHLTNPKFQVESIRMVSEGDYAFEAELKDVWTIEFNSDLVSLERKLKDRTDHQAIWLLVCKVADSGCVMGAEGVREVGNQMMISALAGRYDQVNTLITAARAEFDEFNLLWGLYKLTWKGRQRSSAF